MSPQENKHSDSEIDKTLVMSVPAGGGASAQADRKTGTNRREEAEIDKTIVMSTPAGGAEPPRAASRTGKHETPERQDTVKEFLTGTFRRFGRTKDIDLVVGIHSETASDVKIENVEEPVVEQWNVTDRFKVHEPFAGGGQAVISTGEDIQLKRLVAIKSLRQELLADTKQRADFVSEARVTAQLDHPSIVPLYSLHTDDRNGLHLAMKLIHGQDFKTYLNKIITQYEQEGVLRYDEEKSLRYRLDIFLKVCDALEYAHSRNIMHGDLKPENIMIGKYHDAYLMDWGIARQIKDPAFDPAKWVPPSHITGTPRFLSPEAVMGEYCDERADIYAMGLILYEITTLAEAYTAETPREILAKIQAEDIRPLKHRFRYPIDSELKAIIRKASAWKREERYQSISDLSGDIRKYLRNEEVSARPDNIFQKAARWCVNHRIASLMFLFIVFLAGAGMFTFNLISIMQHEREEFVLRATLGNAFQACTDIGFDFDKKLNGIESDMRVIASELEFMLASSMPVSPKVPCVMHDNYRSPDKAPATFRYSDAFHEKYDFEHICCRPAPGQPAEECMERARKVAMLQHRFQMMMLTSPFGAQVTKKNFAHQLEQMQMSGVPMSLIYLGFNDGLHFCYPGKAYKDDSYDPRNRSWYRCHLKPDVPDAIWSTPYLNANRNGFVMTLSVRVDDPDDRLRAVLAADFDIKKLISELSNGLQDDDSILERTFISDSGAVLLSTNPLIHSMVYANFQAHQDSTEDIVFDYPDKKLLDQIKLFKNGYVDLGTEETGRKVYCVFSKCQSLNWYYFEKIDIQKRIQKLEFEKTLKSAKTRKRPGWHKTTKR